MRLFKSALVGILLLFVIIPHSLIATGQETEDCNRNDGAEICVTEYSIAQSSVNVGEETTVNIRLRNVGNVSAGVRIVFAVDQPNGPPTYDNYARLSTEELGEIAPGESVEIPVTFRAKKGSAPGRHDVNVLVLNAEGTHLFDATGYTESILVRNDPLTLDDISKVIQTTEALIGLGSAVVAVLAYFFGKSRRG